MVSLRNILALSLLTIATISNTVSAQSGMLYGVFRSDNGCILMSLSPDTGDNTTIANVDICDKATNGLFPSYSAYDATNNALIIAIQSAPDVYSVDITTGKSTSLVPLPTYNSSDFLLGLQLIKNTIYVVTQYHVYSAPLSGASSLTDLKVPLSAPQYAQVATVPTGGSGGAARLFIADENSKAIYIVDLGAPTAKVNSISSTIGGTILLQYSTNVNQLVELLSYQLYVTNPNTGKSTKLNSVPDGSGYPRVNGLSPDQSSIFIIDFDKMFTMSLKDGTVGPFFPFKGAPRVVGFPQWVAA